MINRLIKALFLSLPVLLLAACDGSSTDSTSAIPDNAVEWKQYIGAHTRGEVSKNSKITIRFINDIADDHQVGTDVIDVVSFSPEIKGQLIFNNKREIMLIPDTPLSSGQSYQVTVKGKGLKGVPSELDDYVFDVRVIKQALDINVERISTEPGTDNRLQIIGTVITSDQEDPEQVKKVLNASLAGTPLLINWQHSPNGRRHIFTLSGVERLESKQKVELSWDGGVINVDKSGSRSIDIPAKGDFKVAHVRVVQGDRQYIEVQFSDNLDKNQDLNGLVQISVAGFTTEVERSILKIYPSSGITGNITLNLNGNIRNKNGAKLGDVVTRELVFTSQEPRVKFSGEGVILPGNTVLTVPFEAINVESVQITALQIYESNIGQFLQTNKLTSSNDVERVGRYMWRKTITLDSPKPDQWNRYAFDVTDLLKESPGSLFQITISINRSNSSYSCTEVENAIPARKEDALKNRDDVVNDDNSNWDYYESYYNTQYYSDWDNRSNPCTDGYYRFSENVKATRNFMSSNIGLIVKQGQDGKVSVVATDIGSTEPLSGVDLKFYNYQNQLISRSKSDDKGFSSLKINGRAYYLVAEHKNQFGYLKLSDGNALPTSHFDVGGQTVNKGLKGTIYGERGVWRPGDNIYLTFVLEDKHDVIPSAHPVNMELYNPQGQLIQSITNSTPVGNFYAFNFQTAEEAVTGDWRVKAVIGGSQFVRKVKIETVVPNRLKIELDFPGEMLSKTQMPLKATIFSQWLHGATANKLRTEVSVRLSPIKTKFGRFTDFNFDDPAREFSSSSQVIFDGNLDNKGYAKFEADITPYNPAPGMLRANFTSKVFEEGGAFSINASSIKFHPYKQYIGIRLPKGDQKRNMLLTDVKHTVDIASLDENGDPVSVGDVVVTMYKINWKWWWDQSGESLAQYSQSYYSSNISQSTISTKDGVGKWEFEIKYPQWGRYLIRACDKDGGHCTGKVFYIDWPAWASRAQEDRGVGASVLNFSSDKERYTVGDVAKVKLPKASKGRALVTVENGTGIVSQKWVILTGEEMMIDVPIKKNMSPNVYVSVTMLQPHTNKDNDRPIRMYGAIPLIVDDPTSILKPEIKVADEWKPKTKVNVDVSEANGRAMTYTIAIVDEGLLGITNFKTPNLHKKFYRKEALGVKTWDLFDEVAGAYGGELERILSLGGDDDAGEDDKDKKKRRFPPVVKYLGPFELAAGETKNHTVEIPQYLGAVRVMVVAGKDSAYGSASKEVPVREALGLLTTLPRVIGPGEILNVPVSVFAMNDKVKNVTLKLETDDLVEVIGSASTDIQFSQTGEQIGFIQVKVGNKLGKTKMTFTATSGEHTTSSEIYIDIRNPNPATTRTITQKIKPSETWDTKILPHGVEGTNRVSLEVSSVPPMNLEGRLDYLIRYPHGCAEQTTSSVFPQLYLPGLVKLTDAQSKKVQHNVEQGIERLRTFQQPGGGFTYWPGHGKIHDWATNYVGHFLIEAKRLGYYVPPQMLADWVNHQRAKAQSWIGGSQSSELEQSYRLYTLALANKPELGAMNRLRETRGLSNAARWQLSATYTLVGLNDVALELIREATLEVKAYQNVGLTLGSSMRDQSIILEGLVAVGRWEEADAMANNIAANLSSGKWHSTQTVAYSLMSLARYVGAGKNTGKMTYIYKIGQGEWVPMSVDKSVSINKLDTFPDSGELITINNTDTRPLYATVSVIGLPKAGDETASRKGLGLNVVYTDKDGRFVTVTKVKQGSDLVAIVKVKNNTTATIENIALTHIVPSGWQIHNPRLHNEEDGVLPEIDYQDIRDDRVYTYFELKAGEEKTFKVMLNASFLGHYYLPGINVEAMYDADIHARDKGYWVDVIK